MKRETIIEMTQHHTLYDLLNTAFAQMETAEFVDSIASYLFERDHSDAVMEIWRKDYAENDLLFPPNTTINSDSAEQNGESRPRTES